MTRGLRRSGGRLQPPLRRRCRRHSPDRLECLDIGRHVHGRHYDISVMSCQAKNGVIAESSPEKDRNLRAISTLYAECSTFDTLSRSERAPQWGQTRQERATDRETVALCVDSPARYGSGTGTSHSRHPFQVQTGSSGVRPTGSPSRLEEAALCGHSSGRRLRAVRRRRRTSASDPARSGAPARASPSAPAPRRCRASGPPRSGRTARMRRACTHRSSRRDASPPVNLNTAARSCEPKPCSSNPCATAWTAVT